MSSQIKGSDDHYLFFDVDTHDCLAFREYILKKYGGRYPCLMYDTPHGVHCIVFRRGTFRNTAKDILDAPQVDLSWFRIGLKRGYWFLRQRFPEWVTSMGIRGEGYLTPMVIELAT